MFLNDDVIFWCSVRQYLVCYGGMFELVIIECVKGSFVYDVDGCVIFDFMLGQMSVVFGYSYLEIVFVIGEYVGKFDYLFSGMLLWLVVDFVMCFVDFMFVGFDCVLLFSIGVELNEVVIWMVKFVIGKYEIVGFVQLWYGMMGVVVLVMYSVGCKGVGFVLVGLFVILVLFVYWLCFECNGVYDLFVEFDYVFDLIDCQLSGNFVVFIVELIFSLGGIIELLEGYMVVFKCKCEECGMLLIFDEVQMGVGCIGMMFVCQCDGVMFDILMLLKMFGVGLLFVVMVMFVVIEECVYVFGYLFYMMYVFDLLLVVVGLCVFDVVQCDGFVVCVNMMGEWLWCGLFDLMECFDCIGDVCGCGLLFGVEIVKDCCIRELVDGFGVKIMCECMNFGFSMNIVQLFGMGGVFWIVLLLIVSDEEIDFGLLLLEQVIICVL